METTKDCKNVRHLVSFLIAQSGGNELLLSIIITGVATLIRKRCVF